MENFSFTEAPKPVDNFFFVSIRAIWYHFDLLIEELVGFNLTGGKGNKLAVTNSEKLLNQVLVPLAHLCNSWTDQAKNFFKG